VIVDACNVSCKISFVICLAKYLYRGLGVSDKRCKSYERDHDATLEGADDAFGLRRGWKRL